MFFGLNLNMKNSVVKGINKRRKKRKDSVEKVTGKQRSSSHAQKNIYLNPFLGSVFLSSCMLLKQKKSLRTYSKQDCSELQILKV